MSDGVWIRDLGHFLYQPSIDVKEGDEVTIDIQTMTYTQYRTIVVSEGKLIPYDPKEPS